MPLEGLRWSRDSGSTLCDTPQNGRSRTGWGGVRKYFFFVYLAHDPLLSIVCHKLSVWSVHSLENSIIIYFLVFIGIITLVAFLGFLIDKYFHRVFAFLTGGR